MCSCVHVQTFSENTFVKLQVAAAPARHTSTPVSFFHYPRVTRKHPKCCSVRNTPLATLLAPLSLGNALEHKTFTEHQVAAAVYVTRKCNPATKQHPFPPSSKCSSLNIFVRGEKHRVTVTTSYHTPKHKRNRTYNADELTVGRVVA